jgi:hypothetical protein
VIVKCYQIAELRKLRDDGFRFSTDRVIDVKTEKLNGMGYPKFRTGRRSFGTIEHTRVVIPLTRDQQAIFIATTPDVAGAAIKRAGSAGYKPMPLHKLV